MRPGIRYPRLEDMGSKKVSKSSPLVAGALQSAVLGLGHLSLPVARGFGRLLGRLLWHLPNQFRAASSRNVKRCFPDLEDSRQRQIIRNSLMSTGLNVAEAGAMFHWDRDRLAALEAEVVGLEVMEAALARGKGVVALGPHVGNWEYLNHAVGLRWGMIALYREPRIAELDTYIRRSREHLQATELVPADLRGLRRATEGLKEGRIVAILPDQEPLKGHGVFAPFFGIQALTMTMVSRLVRGFDAAVVFGFAERTPSGRFKVQFFAGPEGIGDMDPVHAATQLNLGVEQCVRACPDQYTWSYRRFRTRPPEELAARDAATARN